MAAYKILFRASVGKDFEKIPKKEIKRLLAKIELLAQDPRPVGCEKLSGKEQYRIRQGNYRIVYSVQDREVTVWVVRVGHRRDVYRKQ